ncbi:MAG: hypothetical protein ACM3N4_00190, partial [Nitrososphaerota archaeon]
MYRHSQTPTMPSEPARSTSRTSRWLLVAVALCGALAGGSIVEAIAALASRADTPISPDHLIAEPLALAGAVCGALLAAVLANKDQYKPDSDSQAGGGLVAPIDVSPHEPMMWQPTPYTLLGAQAPAPSKARSPRGSRRA